MDIINTLTAAQAACRLKGRNQTAAGYPRILCIDEEVELSACIDKTGADLLFQVISQRYERGSIVLHDQPTLQTLGQRSLN